MARSARVLVSAGVIARLRAAARARAPILSIIAATSLPFATLSSIAFTPDPGGYPPFRRLHSPEWGNAAIAGISHPIRGGGTRQRGRAR